MTTLIYLFFCNFVVYFIGGALVMVAGLFLYILANSIAVPTSVKEPVKLS